MDNTAPYTAPLFGGDDGIQGFFRDRGKVAVNNYALFGNARGHPAGLFLHGHEAGDSAARPSSPVSVSQLSGNNLG